MWPIGLFYHFTSIQFNSVCSLRKTILVLLQIYLKPSGFASANHRNLMQQHKTIELWRVTLSDLVDWAQTVGICRVKPSGFGEWNQTLEFHRTNDDRFYGQTFQYC